MNSLNYLKNAIQIPKQENEMCEGLNSPDTISCTVSSTADKDSISSQHKQIAKKCDPGHSAPKERKEIRIKMLLQQCLSASLSVTDPDGNFSLVQIGRGMVVYVCFLRGCKQESIDQAVKTLFKLRLSESDVGSMVTIQDIEGDILIVPQSTLGGRIKGSAIQYHSNISKEEGLKLFDAFVGKVRESVNKELKCKVLSGIYGERQVLRMDTNGPFSHIIDI